MSSLSCSKFYAIYFSIFDQDTTDDSLYSYAYYISTSSVMMLLESQQRSQYSFFSAHAILNLTLKYLACFYIF